MLSSKSKKTRTANATDKARNEQQKSLLLCEVARERCQTANGLVPNTETLLRESRKVYQKAATLTKTHKCG